SEKIFQEQLITIVKNNEEQQRNEKNRLQEEIRNKDKNKSTEFQNILQQQSEIRKDALEEKEKKEKELNEERKVKDLIKDQKSETVNASLRKELELGQQIKEKDFERQIIVKDHEKEQAVLDAKLRSFIPNLFMKLCKKSTLDEKKTDEYLEVLTDEKISLAQMIRKVDVFMIKEMI
ncbi:unnamed protein product, partial [Didymodactylos carnosus]